MAPDDETVEEFFRTCKVDEDYLDMYKRLLKFLGVPDFSNKQQYRLPPVCCPQSELEINSECLRWLHHKADQEAKKQNLPFSSYLFLTFLWLSLLSMKVHFISNIAALPRLQFASLEAFAQIAVFHKYQTETTGTIFSDDEALKKAFIAHKYYTSLQTLK